MSRGSKHRTKNIRHQRQGPRVEIEDGGTIFPTDGDGDDDDVVPATRPGKSQAKSHGRHGTVRREPTSPSVSKDNTAPTGDDKPKKPKKNRNSHHGPGLYDRQGSIIWSFQQPHRRQSSPQPVSSSFSHANHRRSVRPNTPTCSACSVMLAVNKRLYGTLLSSLRRDRAALAAWADDVGIGDGSTIEEMDWQPEPMTIVVERRVSEMRRMIAAAEASGMCYPEKTVGYDRVGGGGIGPWNTKPAMMGMGIAASRRRSADPFGLRLFANMQYGDTSSPGFGQNGNHRQDGPIRLPPPQTNKPFPNIGSPTTAGVRSRSMNGYGPETTSPQGTKASISYPMILDSTTSPRGSPSPTHRWGTDVSDAFASARGLCTVVEGRSQPSFVEPSK